MLENRRITKNTAQNTHTHTFTQIYIFSPPRMTQQPYSGPDSLPIDIMWSHSDTPQSVGLLRTSDRSDAEISDNTQHSQKTDIHDRGKIRTHNPSKRTAADPRLRTRGHWDWFWFVRRLEIMYVCVCVCVCVYIYIYIYIYIYTYLFLRSLWIIMR